MSERRPVIPQDMKAFNRAIVSEWRANAGWLSRPMAGRNLILLTTTGARSGQPRTPPALRPAAVGARAVLLEGPTAGLLAVHGHAANRARRAAGRRRR